MTLDIYAELIDPSFNIQLWGEFQFYALLWMPMAKIKSSTQHNGMIGHKYIFAENENKIINSENG